MREKRTVPDIFRKSQKISDQLIFFIFDNQKTGRWGQFPPGKIGLRGYKFWRLWLQENDEINSFFGVDSIFEPQFCANLFFRKNIINGTFAVILSKASSSTL